MAKGLVNESSLNSIGEAINILNGTEGTYAPSEMGEAIIDAIPTETASGNPIYITDAAHFPAESVVTTLEPVQDLHGYDKPWPAGGGGNLLSTGNAFDVTVNDVQFQSDGNGKYTISGDTSDSAYYTFDIPEITLSQSSIYVHLLNSIAVSTGALEFFYNNTNLGFVAMLSKNRISNLAALSGATINKLRLNFNNGISGSIVLQPMLMLNDTATTFEPYSNECPISGHTGVELTRTGKNLWNGAWVTTALNNEYYGQWQTNYLPGNMAFPVTPGESYTFSVNGIATLMRYRWLDRKKNSLSNLANAYTVTAPENAYYMMWRWAGDGSATSGNLSGSAQLELNNTATAHEPYTPETHTQTFPALGKNKLPIIKSPGSYVANNVTFVVNTDGTITCSGTNSGNEILFNFTNGTIPNTFTGMTLTGGISQDLGVAITFYNDGAWSGAVISTGGERTISSGASHIAGSVRIPAGATVSGTVKPMIRDASIADATFEPYTNTAYGCEVDWVNGVLRVNRKFVAVTNNNIGDGSISAAGLNLGKIADDAKPFSNSSLSTVKSDSLPTVTADTMWNSDANGVSVNSSGRVLIGIAGITRFVDLQTYLSNNPIQVCYELATPLEIPLTPEVITLLKGENNVWTDSGESEVEYKVDLQGYIQKLITNT